MFLAKERCRLLGLAALAFTALPVYADVPPLSVSGNQILSGGDVASFAGNSFFWSNTGWQQEKMYNRSVVQWLKQDWNTKIVRVALGADEGGSYLEDPVGNLQRIQTVVDAAIDNDLYVIIDFHSHHAEDKKDVAINFFTQMAERYGDNNHVIYEIYNEPLQVSWSQVIKPYAQDVISAIRAIDPDNLIVVGTPTWSQDVDVASQDPIDGTNIAYALHFYAGTHGQFLRDKAQTALNNGVALMVTEWGAVNADGNGGVAQASVNEWMSFLRSNNLSHVNWAVSDKNEGASIIYPGVSPTGNWSAADLTPSGTLVKSIIANWAGAGDDNGDNGGGGNGGGGNGGGDNGGGDNSDPEAGVTCEHLLVSQWHGGFQGVVRITNNSSSPINGWQVNWNYSDNTVITNSWGGNVSGGYSASNVDWNATVAPQQSVEVGFIASGSGNVSEVTGEICGAATGDNNEEDNATGDGGNSNNEPFSQTYSGEGTFYAYQGGGNCSLPKPSTILTAAMNTADYGNSAACGGVINVTNVATGLSVVARVDDQCPECAPGDVDLSQEAFAQISDLSAGRVPIEWHYIANEQIGNIKLFFKEGSSQWWTAVQVRDHRYPIARLEYRVSGTGENYQNVARESYNYFVGQSGFGVGPYDFRITDVLGQVVEVPSVVFELTTEIDAGVQFPHKDIDNGEGSTDPGVESEASVQQMITNDWGSGYCADVTVSNPSSTPLTWSIELPVDGVVDNTWNATGSQNGSLLLASGVSWNAELAAGDQTQFGYCARL